jgi:hypothetical protein
MTDTSDNPGWDDPEDTLPPFPEEPEHYGPEIPSQYGNVRMGRTAGVAWADVDGVEVFLFSPGSGDVGFRVDRPLALRLKSALEEVLLAAEPSWLLSPDSRPPQLTKPPQISWDYYILPFTVDDEPELIIKSYKHDKDWLYFSLTSRRASLTIQMHFGIAFHLHEWLSDAARTPNSEPRELGMVFCEVPWPACPNCLGEPLACSGGIGSCVRCGQKWLADSSSCARAATHQLLDSPTGERHYFCSSHAEYARRAITPVDNAAVEPIPADLLVPTPVMKAVDITG